MRLGGETVNPLDMKRDIETQMALAADEISVGIAMGLSAYPGPL